MITINTTANNISMDGIELATKKEDINSNKEQNKPAETIYRVPDKIGNLFEQSDRTDRKYGKGGRLKEDNNYFYHYDVEGNLCFKEFKQNKGFTNFGKQAIEKKYGIKFKASGTGWLYEWAANGMLKKVVNPEQGKIRFGYDALGRRIYKQTKTYTTHWLWNAMYRCTNGRPMMNRHW